MMIIFSLNIFNIKLSISASQSVGERIYFRWCSKTWMFSLSWQIIKCLKMTMIDEHRSIPVIKPFPSNIPFLILLLSKCGLYLQKWIYHKIPWELKVWWPFYNNKWIYSLYFLLFLTKLVLHCQCRDCRLPLMNGDNCSTAVISVKKDSTMLVSGQRQNKKTIVLKSCKSFLIWSFYLNW